LTELARIEKVVVLQSADLFAHCRAEEILRIAAIAQERTFRTGEVIYELNDPADSLYCIVHGEVRLEPEGGSSQELGPLLTFGVPEILSGRLRAERATASKDTLTLAIDTEDFFDLLSQNIEIVRALFRRFLPLDGPFETRG
jgi:CRP/FNR family transcriptional regulator